MTRTLALAVLLVAVASGVSNAALTSSASHEMVVDGITRNYLLYRSPNIPAGSQPPLVVVMHGGFGRASGVERRYHWNDEADAGHFLVVYPNGVENSWNSGNCCMTALQKNIDDVKFLTMLVRQLETDENADPQRIYFTGMSNGALMSYRMACEAKFPIAAIAPVAGTIDVACPSPQKTSLIAINGRADRMIPFDGGKNADPSTAGAETRAWRGNLPSIESDLGRWLALDGCATPTTKREPPLTTKIATCPDRRAVELISIDGAGHEWPGAVPSDPAAVAALAQRGVYVDPPFTGLDATHAIWQFFSTKRSSVT